MEVCGGHTHAIYRHGLQRPIADQRRAHSRPGLPGLRACRRAASTTVFRSREQPNVIMTCLRRHDARAGHAGNAARAQSARRRHSHGVFAARRAADRTGKPRKTRVLLRDRFRDDRAVDRAHAAARARRLAFATSRSSAITSRSFPRFARFSIRPTCASTVSSVPGTCRRSRAAARTSSSRATTASRSSSRASSRSTSSKRSLMILRQLRAKEAQRRESVPAHRSVGGKSAGAASDRRSLRVAPVLRVARARVSSRNRRCKIRRPIRAVGCRGAVRGSGRPRDRSKGGAVRRGAQGRAQTAAVQAFRQGVQSRASDRGADGFERGRVRGVLSLRASTTKRSIA